MRGGTDLLDFDLLDCPNGSKCSSPKTNFNCPIKEKVAQMGGNWPIWQHWPQPYVCWHSMKTSQRSNTRWNVHWELLLQITFFTCLLGRLNETNKQDHVTIKPFKEYHFPSFTVEVCVCYLGRRRALLGFPHAALVTDVTWFHILWQIRPAISLVQW